MYGMNITVLLQFLIPRHVDNVPLLLLQKNILLFWENGKHNLHDCIFIDLGALAMQGNLSVCLLVNRLTFDLDILFSRRIRALTNKHTHTDSGDI